jgi:hypothetical protein
MADESNCGKTLKSGLGCGRCEACLEEAAQNRNAFDVIDRREGVKHDLWCIYSTDEGFCLGNFLRTMQGNLTLELHKSEGIYAHTLTVEYNPRQIVYQGTKEACTTQMAEAKQVEKDLRPMWQAAIEHAQRVENIMLETVYSVARGKR